MRTSRSLQSGMTLIEVLVALTVFSIGALGVLGMVTITLQLNQSSKQITEATQLGIRHMERMQMENPATSPYFAAPCDTRCWLSDTDGAAGTAIAPVGAAEVIRPYDLNGGIGSGAYYEITWRVTQNATQAAPITALNYIEIRVLWPKNRDLSGTDWVASGDVDCQATPDRCYNVLFHSYR